jgi:hypothetical protein
MSNRARIRGCAPLSGQESNRALQEHLLVQWQTLSELPNWAVTITSNLQHPYHTSKNIRAASCISPWLQPAKVKTLTAALVSWISTPASAKSDTLFRSLVRASREWSRVQHNREESWLVSSPLRIPGASGPAPLFSIGSLHENHFWRCTIQWRRVARMLVERIGNASALSWS